MTVAEAKQQVLERIKDAPNDHIGELAHAYKTMVEAESAEEYMKIQQKLAKLAQRKYGSTDDGVLDLGEIH